MPTGGKFRSGHPLQASTAHGAVARPGPNPQRSAPKKPAAKQKQELFFFIVADEILPSGKVVRKVLRVPATPEEWILAKPETYGIRPKNPNSTLTIGDHALGNTNSRFTSASNKPGGAPNFEGRPVFIDREKFKASGGRIYEPEEIIADLNRKVGADPSLKFRVEKLKAAISNVEGEVLLEGNVPSTAIKSLESMRLTQGIQALQVFGVAMTVYNLGVATAQSFEKRSAKPIAAETVRQAGGWGGALAGGELGAELGAAVGIETGPGAILTSAAGAFIFGTAGFFGADWVLKRVHAN